MKKVVFLAIALVLAFSLPSIAANKFIFLGGSPDSLSISDAEMYTLTLSATGGAGTYSLTAQSESGAITTSTDFHFAAPFRGDLYLGVEGGYAELHATSDGLTYSLVAANNDSNIINNTTAFYRYYTSGNKLYVGTIGGGNDIAAVYLTRDGVSFQEVFRAGQLGATSTIRYITAIIGFGGHIYVSTGGSGGDGEVYRLGGGGQIHTKVFDPGTFTTVNGLVENNGYLYAITGSGFQLNYIYRTSNGTTWTIVNQPGHGGMPGDDNAFTCLGSYRGQLFAGTYNKGRIYRSRDDGTTWELVATPGTEVNADINYWNVMSVWDDKLWAGALDNTNGAHLYSTSDGTTWTEEFSQTALESTNVFGISEWNGKLVVTTGGGAGQAKMYVYDPATYYSYIYEDEAADLNIISTGGINMNGATWDSGTGWVFDSVTAGAVEAQEVYTSGLVATTTAALPTPTTIEAASIGSGYEATSPPANGLIVEGKVGIGTTAPKGTLDIGGVLDSTRYGKANIASDHATAYSPTVATAAEETALYLQNNNNAADFVSLKLGTREIEKSIWEINNVWRNSFSGDLTFVTRTGASSYAERLRIQNNGRVGIGTTTPETPLQVVGRVDVIDNNISVGADNTLTTRTNETSKFGRILVPHYLNAEQMVSLFMVNSAAGSTGISYGGGASAFNAATNHRFYTAADNVTTTGTEHMRLSSTGGLSIGTAANANQKLTVGGTMDLLEVAAAAADTVAYGQIWVKNTDPCELWFTDDAGTDTLLASHPGDAPPELYTYGPGVDWMGVRVQHYLGIIFWQTIDGTVTEETFAAYNLRRKDAPGHVDLVQRNWRTTQEAERDRLIENLITERLETGEEVEVVELATAVETVEVVEVIEVQEDTPIYKLDPTTGKIVQEQVLGTKTQEVRTGVFEARLKRNHRLESTTGKVFRPKTRAEITAEVVVPDLPEPPAWLKARGVTL